MRALFLIVVVLFGVLAPRPAFCDDPELDDNQQNLQDTQDVIMIRKYLESKYLSRISLTNEQNEEMHRYINWLMEPVEALVYKGKLMTNMRWKQVGGSSGSGKTAVARDFIDMMIACKLMDPKRQWYQQGEKGVTINLSKVNTWGVTEQVLKRDNPEDGYNATKNRFLATFALAVWDEATHFDRPPQDLDKSLKGELRKLKTAVEKRKKQIENAPPSKPQPPKPDRKDREKFAEGPAGDTAFAKAMAQYGVDRVTWEQEQSAIKAKQIADIDIDDEIRRLNIRFGGIAANQKDLEQTLKRIWQATSNGNVLESVQAEDDKTIRSELEKIELDMRQFRLKYAQKPLFGFVETFVAEIGKKMEGIRAEAKKRDEQELKNKHLEYLLKSLEGIPGKAIEDYLTDPAHNLMDTLEKMSGGPPPEFIEKMLTELRAKPGVFTADQFGFDPAKVDPGSEKMQKLRRWISEGYRGQIKTGQDEVTASNLLIKQMRAEVTEMTDAKKEFAITQQGTEAVDHKEVAALVRDWNELVERRNNKIWEAVHKTGGARRAVDKFIDNLKVADLEEGGAYAAYGTHLKNLRHNLTTWLDDLRKCDDPERKFIEMLTMNDTKARDEVFTAVTKPGTQTDPLYMGNINVIFAMNLREKEQAAKEFIDRIHQGTAAIKGVDGKPDVPAVKGRKVHWDELAQFYKDLVLPGWTDEFFKDYFPELFRETMRDNGVSGNPIAEARRTTGTGAVFLGPQPARVMVNSVAGTLQTEFDEWVHSKEAAGVDVKVDLFIHESVPPLFVRDDQNAELGMNASLESTKEGMGALLAQLNKLAMERHLGVNGQQKGPFHVKIAICNEPVPGEQQQRLVLRFMSNDPATLPQSKILRGKEYEFSANSLAATWKHNYQPAASLQVAVPATDGKPALPALNVAPVEPVITAEEIPITEAEAAAKKKREADAKGETDKKEADKARGMLQARVKNELKGPVDVEKIKLFYDGLKNDAERDIVRDELLRHALNRRNGITLAHLYEWLKNDADHGRNADVDHFVLRNADTIRQRASFSLRSLFPSLVFGEDANDAATKKLVGGYKVTRAIRTGMEACGWDRMLRKHGSIGLDGGFTKTAAGWVIPAVAGGGTASGLLYWLYPRKASPAAAEPADPAAAQPPPAQPPANNN